MGEAKRKRETQRTASELGWTDAEIVLLSADAFRACSRPFIDRVLLHGLDVKAALQEGTDDKGGMIASAVNLAFAVELYLKGLRIIHKVPTRITHELDRLYLDLPADLRRTIEEEYGRVVVAQDQPLSLGLSISPKGTTLAQRMDLPPPPTDHTLVAVLQRSRDVFEVWRYLYEQGAPGTVTRRAYEFYFLGIAADVLRAHVKRGLEEWKAREVS